MRHFVRVSLCAVVAALAACSAPAGDESRGVDESTATEQALSSSAGGPRARNFHFVEESERLGADTSPEGTSTTDLDLVDIDGDGDLDLYVTQGTAGPDGRADRLYANDGQGVFTDETSTRLARVNNTTNTAGAAFGDIDGDGDPDALLANLGQEQLLINDGNGVFDEAPPGRIPVTPFDPRSGVLDVSAGVAFADVNEDGALDALISNENPFLPGPLEGAQNRLYLNDGTGTFVEAALPPALDQSVAQLTGDIDGDGDLDIVVLNRGQERILIGDGSGSFKEETAERIPAVDLSVPNVSSSRGGGLADLDDDGDLDLIVGNSRGQPVEYYENDGCGFFDRAAFAYRPEVTDTVTGLVLIDLDRDGDLDVYLPDAGEFDAGPAGHGFFGARDHYLRNNGRGKFQDRTTHHFDLPNDPTTAATFGDLDGDGDLDLVVGNTDDNVPGDNGGERVFIQRRRGR
jgi:hypothetical protein